ncbi:MAG: hypothetical protein ACREEC_00120 [Thermoplasmata archaeon]
MANLEVEVWQKNGDLVASATLAAFFAAPSSSSLGDPRVIYDNLSERWYASVLDASALSVLLAVSPSSGPTMGWTVYQLPAYPNELPNLPDLGVSEWMIGVSANDVNQTTENLDGTGYSLVNRTEVDLGTEASYYDSDPQLWEPGGLAESALSPASVQWFAGINSKANSVFWVNWSDAPPAVPRASTAGVVISHFGVPPPAAQPGTFDRLDTGDNSATSAVWKNGLETVTFTDGATCQATLSCVRLVQVYPGNGTVRQDMSVSSTSNFLFDPAANLDAQGDVTLVAGFSSNSTYPSVYVFGQAWNEPGSLANGSFTAVAGSGDVNASGSCDGAHICAFGESFGAAPDPNSSTIWTASEYGGSGVWWDTWIQGARTAPFSLLAGSAPEAIDLGQPGNLSVVPSGGDGPAGDYEWRGLPAGCASSDARDVSCRPTASGTFLISVVANDPYGTTANASLTLVVRPPPSVSDPLPNLPAADVGQRRTFNVTASAGSAPYTFSWSGFPSGCPPTSTDSMSCSFSAAGALSLSVAVTDALGDTASSGVSRFTISPALSVGPPTASQSRMSSGTTTTLSVAVAGGSGGFGYSWAGLPTGCASRSASSLACTPTATGSFNVSVTITDSNGASATSGSLSVIVTPPPRASSVGPLGGPANDEWILIGLLLLGGAALATLVLRGRRKIRRAHHSPADTPRSSPSGSAGPAVVPGTGPDRIPPTSPPPV